MFDLYLLGSPFSPSVFIFFVCCVLGIIFIEWFLKSLDAFTARIEQQKRIINFHIKFMFNVGFSLVLTVIYGVIMNMIPASDSAIKNAIACVNKTQDKYTKHVAKRVLAQRPTVLKWKVEQITGYCEYKIEYDLKQDKLNNYLKQIH